jgi:hypothetical protein
MVVATASCDRVGQVATAPAESAAASPTQTPSLPTMTVPFSCRLPITWGDPAGKNGYLPFSGFLAFPGQEVTEDLTAGEPQAFYDRALGRWLGVPREAVSNDGKRFAQAYQSGGDPPQWSVGVFDIKTGANTTIYSGDLDFSVVSFSAEGIYLTRNLVDQPQRGLWIVDLAGGAPRLISDSVAEPWVAAGVGWGIDFDATDPKPARGTLGGPYNRLLRINLNTGATTPWFTSFGADLHIAGVDYSGNPFVDVSRPNPSDPSTATEEFWFFAGSTTGQRLFAGPSDGQWPGRLGAIENHGAWFSSGGASLTSPSSVWLYTAGAVHVVATVNLPLVKVAGGCIDV